VSCRCLGCLRFRRRVFRGRLRSCVVRWC
jgi:hypothetical protein